MSRDNKYLIGNKFAVGSKPNKTAFKDGQAPWNKGKKGIHLSRETEWKKGVRGIHWVVVGTIRRRKRYTRLDERNFIKISEPNKWEEYAKYLWKKIYGKLLKGDVVHHINGIKTDDRIENIIALPRTDHPIFHSKWGLRQLSEKQLEFYRERYKN